MDVRFGLLILIVLGDCWVSAANQMAATDLSVKNTVISHIQALATRTQEKRLQIHVSDAVVKTYQVCTLCEEYVAQALDYLSENKTQTEVIDILHLACSSLPTFKQQCITLVDYYASLVFSEISSIQPEEFCQKVHLCEYIVTSFLQTQEDSCRICHHAISKVILKLKDPDTKLEITELLLKACNPMNKYAAQAQQGPLRILWDLQQCETLVFEYGPLVLANAEHFLESTDICIMLHACVANGEQVTIKMITNS